MIGVSGPQFASSSPVFGAKSASVGKFGRGFSLPDAFVSTPTAVKNGPSIGQRLLLGLRYAFKPGKLFKSAALWTIILGLPIALSAGLGAGLIPIFMIPGLIRRFYQGVAHPGRVALLLS